MGFQIGQHLVNNLAAHLDAQLRSELIEVFDTELLHLERNSAGCFALHWALHSVDGTSWCTQWIALGNPLFWILGMELL